MKEIRFGIIGAGLWGSLHADIYSSHPTARLVAVGDIDDGKARDFARRYLVEKVYTDVDRLAADPEVDAVAIVTPDFAHREAIVACAARGKHIIVEKPLATNREDLKAIRHAVQSAGIHFMVDFHTRWSPPIEFARRDIESGALGVIQSAYYRLNDTIMVPTEMLSWASKSSVLWFLGSHTVDTLRYLFQDEVRRVYCVSRRGLLEQRGIATDDLFQAILEFESGIVASIENNWIIPNSSPKINDIKVNILGSKGMYHMDMTNNQTIERYLETSSDHPDFFVKANIQGKSIGFAYESIRWFVDRLAQDEPVTSSGLEDGLRVSQVVFALFESARRREPVMVDYTL